MFAKNIFYIHLRKKCYDDNNLCFLFECKDPDIWADFTQRDEYFWDEEVVEVFIDVDNVPEPYVKIEVSPVDIILIIIMLNVKILTCLQPQALICRD